MNDLTVIYYTANFAHEEFTNATRKQLLKSIGDTKLISVSQKPMDFGENICVGDIGRSQVNIYKQVLVGARAAKTKYVALCEDDCLYTPTHFTTMRPDDDQFAYNDNRWGLYTWTVPPIFSIKHRIVLSQCIAPRDLLIECAEERFTRFPNEKKIPLYHFAEFGKYEHHMGITVRKVVLFSSAEPTIMFSHPEAIGFSGLGARKKHGDEKVAELPYWGSAEKILNEYYNKGLK